MEVTPHAPSVLRRTCTHRPQHKIGMPLRFPSVGRSLNSRGLQTQVPLPQGQASLKDLSRRPAATQSHHVHHMRRSNIYLFWHTIAAPAHAIHLHSNPCIKVAFAPYALPCIPLIHSAVGRPKGMCSKFLGFFQMVNHQNSP